MKLKGSELEFREPVHLCTSRVIYGDTDAGGVVYYGNYLRFFEKGRAEFLRSILNMTYRELEEEGIVLPVSEAYCRYKAPARYDDLLAISTCIADYNRVSVRFHYRIERAGEAKCLAMGLTVHAAIGRESGRLSRLPERLVLALGGLYASL